MCQAQGFPVPKFRFVVTSFFILKIEPMGAKVPTFSTEGSMVTRQASHGFALLCQAQGYPVPSFR